MMSLWDALRMNMMISYQELVRTFLSTLSPEQLEMIHQTGYEAGVYSQKLTLERDAEMLKTMQAAGVEVIYPDTGPFQKKAREVYSQFPEWTPGLYETIQQQLQ